MIIGSHVPLAGQDQFLGSIKETISNGANALMVYTGAPQNTMRKPVEAMKIAEAHKLMDRHGLNKSNIIVHAPYIVNLANPAQTKRDFAVSFLSQEIIRSASLGAHILVLHPGAHMGQGLEKGIDLIAEGLNRILKQTSHSGVSVALEGMAGKGSEIGSFFSELKAIIDRVIDNDRIGICLDTCHSYDAGYDVKDDFDGVLREFHDIVGLDKLLVVHINDSKNPIGSHKDRHENIGFGSIGFAAILHITNHPFLTDIPKILETPYIKSPTDTSRSYPPYKLEIEMLRNHTFNHSLIENVIREYEGDGSI